jgi:hypothetical protein
LPTSVRDTNARTPGAKRAVPRARTIVVDLQSSAGASPIRMEPNVPPLLLFFLSLCTTRPNSRGRVFVVATGLVKRLTAAGIVL